MDSRSLSLDFSATFLSLDVHLRLLSAILGTLLLQRFILAVCPLSSIPISVMTTFICFKIEVKLPPKLILNTLFTGFDFF